MPDFSSTREYLNGLAKRIASLEVKAEELTDDMQDQRRRIHETSEEHHEDLSHLRDEIDDLKKEISELNTAVKSVLQTFKRVTREDSLDRLKRKVKEWSPEELATHKDMHRHLEKLKK